MLNGIESDQQQQQAALDLLYFCRDALLHISKQASKPAGGRPTPPLLVPFFSAEILEMGVCTCARMMTAMAPSLLLQSGMGNEARRGRSSERASERSSDAEVQTCARIWGGNGPKSAQRGSRIDRMAMGQKKTH